MDGFAPVVVALQSETRDSVGLVAYLIDFFFKRHARNEIGGTLVRAQSLILVRKGLSMDRHSPEKRGRGQKSKSFLHVTKFLNVIIDS